jgi:hypothetical protein
VQLEVWDSGFVRAHRRGVHALLGDVAGYQRWWPGVSGKPRDDHVVLTLRPAGARPAHRIRIQVTKQRPNLGVNLRYHGDLVGDAEWYYLDEPNGVVIHYLLHADTPRRSPRRLLRAHRWCIREALHAVKDVLEGGRLPGAEPDAAFLEHQRRAIAEFQAGVEAHARKVAAAREDAVRSDADGSAGQDARRQR